MFYVLIIRLGISVIMFENFIITLLSYSGCSVSPIIELVALIEILEKCHPLKSSDVAYV